jgi:pilus assembly protein CpaF
MEFAPLVKFDEFAPKSLLIPREEPSGNSSEDQKMGPLDPLLMLKNTQYGKLQTLMDDQSIEEIWINSPTRIFVARAGVSELTNLVLNEEEIRHLVERLLMWGGRRLDLSHPFVDARLPDGSRLHASIPEVTAKHWAINIRKHLLRGKSIEDLHGLGVMDEAIAIFLTKCVFQGLNILVSGSTQAGKTTLLNALISETPINSRVITVEEVFELKPRVPDCIALQTRPSNLQGEGEIPLRRLIKEALRMRPSHLIVGEIREAESLDLLIALNSGLPGMATIHANSGRDAVAKLQTLPLLAGGNISHSFIAPLVASAIDIVVHVGIDTSGFRRVLEVLYVSGRIEGQRVECENLFKLNENSNNDITEVREGEDLAFEKDLYLKASHSAEIGRRRNQYLKGLGDLNRVFKTIDEVKNV